MSQVPREHHYAPQFYLRNFANNAQRTSVTTVGKSGNYAIWAERSIGGIGVERDFYVHLNNGVPTSVEETINREVETPLSSTSTWAKITSGNTEDLDVSDKPNLYALIRHLQARSPHFQRTVFELAAMAADPRSEIPFTAEERQHYAELRENPEFAKALLNGMAASISWSQEAYHGSGLAILRSPICLRTSTVPAMAVGSPNDPALDTSLPGTEPHQLILTLNPSTLMSLVIGHFENGFLNIEIDEKTARGFNRQIIAQFAYFDSHRHLVTPRDGLIEEMAWAGYSVVTDKPSKIVFYRE